MKICVLTKTVIIEQLLLILQCPLLNRGDTSWKEGNDRRENIEIVEIPRL